MSASLLAAKEKLQYIDAEDRDVVFGFIHDAQNLFPCDTNPYYIIPELIIYIVLNFCYDALLWDKIAAECRILDDKRTLTYLTASENWDNTSYVNVEIDSMENCIAKWYIHIDKLPERHMMIAVVGNKTATDKGFYDKTDYFYWSTGAKKDGWEWTDYAESYGENNEICCILDLKKKEITFEKDGKPQGVAYKDIEYGENFKYRCGVSMCENQTKCSIIKFEKKE